MVCRLCNITLHSAGAEYNFSKPEMVQSRHTAQLKLRHCQKSIVSRIRVFNVNFEGCNYPQRTPQQVFFANERAIIFQFVEWRHILIAGVNITQCLV